MNHPTMIERLEGRRLLAHSLKGVEMLSRLESTSVPGTEDHLHVLESDPAVSSAFVRDLMYVGDGRVNLSDVDQVLDPNQVMIPYLDQDPQYENLSDEDRRKLRRTISKSKLTYEAQERREESDFQGAWLRWTLPGATDPLVFRITLDSPSRGSIETWNEGLTGRRNDPFRSRTSISFRGRGIDPAHVVQTYEIDGRQDAQVWNDRLVIDGGDAIFTLGDEADEVHVTGGRGNDVRVGVMLSGHYYVDLWYEIDSLVTDRLIINTSGGDDTVYVNYKYAGSPHDAWLPSGGDWRHEVVIDAGAGDDVVNHAGHAATIYGGEGDDFIYAYGAFWEVAIVGGDGDDSLYGSKHDDHLEGNGGRDLLDGRWGNDALYGGRQPDTLIGGRGADYLFGGRSLDMYYGGEHEDVVFTDEREKDGPTARFVDVEWVELY